MRPSPKKKIILSLTAAAALPVLLATGSSPASAATSFSTSSSTASVSGAKVTVKATVKSSSKITAQNFSVCVRDAWGNNMDFPKKQRVVISKSGATYQASLNFKAGKYSYFPCVQHQNRWWDGAKKSFTVKPSVVKPTPKPTPAPSPITPPVSPSPTPTAPPAASEPTSTAMPVGDLPGWKQNFKEDFTKDAPLGQVGNVYGWSLRGYDGFNDTSGNGVYAPDKVLSVKDGKLNYNLHSENGKHLVAAPTLNDYKGQTYGRYSVRFRADSMPGYKIAFLLWPNSDQWNEGEIDWPEGNLDEGMMRPALAVPGTYQNGTMRFVPEKESFTKTSAKDWHVATTEWTPSGMKWYWDGELVAATTEKPTTDFRWTLQAETEIAGRVPANDVKGNIEVDWATSYSYAG